MLPAAHHYTMQADGHNWTFCDGVFLCRSLKSKAQVEEEEATPTGGAAPKLTHGSSSSAAAAGKSTAALLDAADEEVRRAVVPVVLPTGGARQRVLLILGQMKLKIFPLPPKAGATVDASTIDTSTLGKPILSLTSDKLLYRKSSDRLKRDCIEVVIMKAKKGGVAARMAAFEQKSAEDILEIYTGGPTETRYWLAAMHSPRYLKARGEHVMSAVGGSTDQDDEAKTSLVDLWKRYALLNKPDKRGEGLLSAAIRGVEPGDEVERCRLIAYLLDAGAECMPTGVSSPSVAAVNLKRASTINPATSFFRAAANLSVMGAQASADQLMVGLAAAGGSLALLLHMATQVEGHAADTTWSEVLSLSLSRADALSLSLSLDPLRTSLRDAFKSALGKAPLTLAVLMGEGKRTSGDAKAAAPSAAKPAPRFGGGGGFGGVPTTSAKQLSVGPASPVSDLAPLPPPSVASQNRTLHLLELSRVDLAGSEISVGQNKGKMHFRIAFVHEPTDKPATASVGGGGGGGGGGGAPRVTPGRVAAWPRVWRPSSRRPMPLQRLRPAHAAAPAMKIRPLVVGVLAAAAQGAQS